MGLIQAIVYGIVQGLTEFLPISSNAHIKLTSEFLFHKDPGAAFTAIIQLGTVAAVLIYFWKDLAAAFMGWARSLSNKELRQTHEARMGWAVFVGTIPVVIAGLLLKKQVETTFRGDNIIAYSLIGLGVVMLVADMYGKRTRKVEDVSAQDGLIVGLWQVLPLIPGMSRSGSTISGARFLGFDRAAAARFSFLLSVPSVAGAGLFEAFQAMKHRTADSATGVVEKISWGPTILSTIVSFIVGYASIAFFIKYLQRRGLGPFVIYRIALGILILVALK